MRNISFLVVAMLVLCSCKKSSPEPEPNDVSSQSQFPNIVTGVCFSGIADYPHNELVIYDDNEYKQLESEIRVHLNNINCDTASLPEIDFSRYTLLAKRTHGGGCGVEYKRSVNIDTVTKKVTYRITAKYFGYCDMYIASMNWALIPKITKDYSVIFEVN